jgi:hypothetical protein
MPRRPLTLLLLLLSLTLSATSCSRNDKHKDKIDDIPRGTGGTPATQLTRPG